MQGCTGKVKIKSVIVHHLVARNTMDEDVMKALASKSTGQEALLAAVKARIKKHFKHTVL
jgi:hypothetical protein